MSETSTLPPPTFRYNSLTILLHWLVALVVTAQWVSGQLINVFPRDGGRLEVRSVHIVLGLTLVGLVLLRLLWRKTPWGGRQPPRAGLGDLAARGVQLLLVVLLGVNILFGLLNVAVRGDAIFTWVKVPPLGGGIPGLRDVVGQLHAWGGNAILAVVGLHAAAALAHHYLLRDTVLSRMLPRGRVA